MFVFLCVKLLLHYCCCCCNIKRRRRKNIQQLQQNQNINSIGIRSRNETRPPHPYDQHKIYLYVRSQFILRSTAGLSFWLSVTVSSCELYLTYTPRQLCIHPSVRPSIQLLPIDPSIRTICTV